MKVGLDRVEGAAVCPDRGGHAAPHRRRSVRRHGLQPPPEIERQLPAEVEYLRVRLSEAEHTAMLDELESLMTVATEKPHRYLWFIGDCHPLMPR